MKIQIETIQKKGVEEVVNSAISYSNTFETLEEVCIHIKMKIAYSGLNKELICGMGSNHIFLSYKDNGSKILIVTLN